MAKTISVSDRAYRRLRSWKTGKGDSFSQVIERLIPSKGSFDAVLEAAHELPVLSSTAAEELEARISETHTPIEDPWKS